MANDGRAYGEMAGGLVTLLASVVGTLEKHGLPKGAVLADLEAKQHLIADQGPLMRAVFAGAIAALRTPPPEGAGG
jgi:hypothetical protein